MKLSDLRGRLEAGIPAPHGAECKVSLGPGAGFGWRCSRRSDARRASSRRASRRKSHSSVLGDPYTLIDDVPRLPVLPQKFVPTDATVEAGFANVPPGYVSVDAFVDETSARISRTSVSVTALPGQLTIVETHARPFGIIPSD